MNNNYNSNTVVKQDFAVVKQVDGRAAHMTNTTQHQNWQIMLDPSLGGVGWGSACSLNNYIIMYHHTITNIKTRYKKLLLYSWLII